MGVHGSLYAGERELDYSAGERDGRGRFTICRRGRWSREAYYADRREGVRLLYRRGFLWERVSLLHWRERDRKRTGQIYCLSACLSVGPQGLCVYLMKTRSREGSL